MRAIQSQSWIFVKGVLFLVLGCASGFLVLSNCYKLRVAILLGLSVWSFCRFYYFMFYVIEHYVDANYRFSGLISFAKYFVSRRGRARGDSGN